MLTSITLWLASLVVRAIALHENIVLNTPEVVKAGAAFSVIVNLADASWPNEECPGPGNCDWKFLRTYLMGDPTYTTMTDRTGESIIWRRYCYLEGCIATNVTTFNATIPTSSFPDGYPYTLDYGLFNINPNDSEDIFHPNFAAFGGTIFNLTAATGNWSDFSYQKADYGLEQYLSSIPCSAVPCVQDCQTEFVEPYVPFPREKGEELDACVEKCRGKANPIADCVVKNATDTHSIRSSSLSTPVLGSTLTSAFTSTSALLGATTTAATATSETQDSGAKGMEVGWMLGQAIVMLMFLMD